MSVTRIQAEQALLRFIDAPSAIAADDESLGAMLLLYSAIILKDVQETDNGFHDNKLTNFLCLVTGGQAVSLQLPALQHGETACGPWSIVQVPEDAPQTPPQALSDLLADLPDLPAEPDGDTDRATLEARVDQDVLTILGHPHAADLELGSIGRCFRDVFDVVYRKKGWIDALIVSVQALDFELMMIDGHHATATSTATGMYTEGSSSPPVDHGSWKMSVRRLDRHPDSELSRRTHPTSLVVIDENTHRSPLARQYAAQALHSMDRIISVREVWEQGEDGKKHRVRQVVEGQTSVDPDDEISFSGLRM